jgi:hypothetical protein
LVEAEKSVLTALIDSGLSSMDARRVISVLTRTEVRSDMMTVCELTPVRLDSVPNKGVLVEG